MIISKCNLISNNIMFHIYTTRRQTRPCLSVLTLILSSILASSAWASTVPDAGSLGNQLQQQQLSPITRPAESFLTLPTVKEGEATDSSPNDTLTVTVNEVRFQGSEGLTVSENQMQHAIAGLLHKPINFAGLHQLVQTVTSLLRNNDMPLAQVVLPPQTIKNGILTVRVIPGHYDHAQINNQAIIRDSLVSRIASTQAPPGTVVLRSKLERTGLLLNNIPGITSYIALQPGSTSGSSLMNIDVTTAARYAGYIAMDNQGDPVTGRARAAVIGQVNGLLGLGDQLQVNLLHSYERNGLLTGTVDYNLLTNGYATRAGLTYSHLRYHFYLQGLKFSGHSNNWALYLSHPWIRQPRARVDVRLDAGQQFLNDNYPDVISTNSQRRIDSGGVAIDGTVSSTPAGLTAFSIRGTTGLAQANKLASVLVGKNHFARFNYQLSHLQHFWGPLSLFASVKGQLASNNLDSSQKFLLGGVDTVRAYDINSGAVDDGYVVTSELRSNWPLPFTLLNNQPELNIAVFYDLGSGSQFRNNFNPQTNAPFIRQDNRVTLAGAGLYMSLMVRGDYSATLTYARRTGKADPISGYRGRDRVWLSAIKAF